MKKILVENIEDGMILDREVTGSSGSPLLSKGAQLTAALGRRLKNWGITYVYVVGDEESPEELNTVSVSPQELKEQLTDKFSLVMNDPVMKKLFVAVYQYRLQKSR